jgi:hypothetical protein
MALYSGGFVEERNTVMKRATDFMMAVHAKWTTPRLTPEISHDQTLLRVGCGRAASLDAHAAEQLVLAAKEGRS